MMSKRPCATSPDVTAHTPPAAPISHFLSALTSSPLPPPPAYPASLTVLETLDTRLPWGFGACCLLHLECPPQHLQAPLPRPLRVCTQMPPSASLPETPHLPKTSSLPQSSPHTSYVLHILFILCAGPLLRLIEALGRHGVCRICSLYSPSAEHQRAARVNCPENCVSERLDK